MNIGDYFPFFQKLTESEKQRLQQTVTERKVEKGEIVHNGAVECVGLLMVYEGRLRAYTISEEGREITLYRLFPRDICLFSASCIMNNIEFDITVEAETDTLAYHIPASVYKKLMKESIYVSNFTSELMASRFSDVMWQMDQILNKRMDSRLAALLLEEMQLSGSTEIKITHETAAKYLGSAREVITRMLKYFQEEGIVTLSRGGITILNDEKLRVFAQGSIR